MQKNAHIEHAHALPWNVECNFKRRGLQRELPENSSSNCDAADSSGSARAEINGHLGFFSVVDKVVEITIALSGHRLFIKFQLDVAQ